MGEAKRKREAIANAPCRCGSQKSAAYCCYTGGIWHKRPARLGIRSLSQRGAVPKCYMNELGSCDGGISREHLISESVIRVLKADGDFSIAGLPWLDNGEAKIVGTNALTANCLCARHNSALSPLDAAAQKFFAALKSCLDREAESLHYLISGHDLERWLLKTVKALAVSKNLGRGRQSLSGAFASDVQVLDMLDEPGAWPNGAGLYCVMKAGALTQNHNRIQLAPYTNTQDELSGLGISLMGLDFVLMLESPDLAASSSLHGAKFRPRQIVIAFEHSVNRISISWTTDRRMQTIFCSSS
jgi:hypothetical protein